MNIKSAYKFLTGKDENDTEEDEYDFEPMPKKKKKKRKSIKHGSYFHKRIPDYDEMLKEAYKP